jgi:hypothetical protein
MALERIESVDEEEEDGDQGTWNRGFVKSVSLKSLKADLKRRQHAAANSAANSPDGKQPK